MSSNPPLSDASRLATEFGRLIRERREAVGMRQEDLALTTGVGRRFLIDLEAGKPSVQLGKALAIANALGLRPLDVMSANSRDDDHLLPDIPE